MSKNRLFSPIFFRSKKRPERTIFLRFWIEKNAFYTKKGKFFKNLKKTTFSEGVSPWFLSTNRPFSYMFSFEQKKKKKTFLNILDSKDNFLDLKSKVLKNSKKSTFCKGISLWCSSNNRPLSYMFFFSKKSQNEKLFNILKKKEYLLDLKGETLAKSKQWTFCKGVSSWFLSKNWPFSDMFLF